MSKTTQQKKAQKAEEKVEVLSNVEGREATTATETETVETETSKVTNETPAEGEAKVRQAKVRGKKYLAAKKKIDVTKYYPLTEAVKLAKATSIAKFEGKLEAHLTTFEAGTVGEITFPHLELASKKIAVSDDSVIAAIKDGKIDFDILVATPATMPKLLPFARVLGPKGLMPNPKNGTLTDRPEEAIKKLSVAKLVVKTEPKAPVIHLVVGKISQPEKELEANVQELINVVKANKIKKLVLCATMGPSVKVEIVR